MSMPDTKDCIQCLDEIIESRRSIRFFKDDTLPKDAIKAVIRAGMFAPYAVGYPLKKLPPAKRQDVNEVTRWLD